MMDRLVNRFLVDLVAKRSTTKLRIGGRNHLELRC